MSRYANCKRGYRTVNRKKIYFDSQAEYRYYLYLDWLKKQKNIRDFIYHPPYFDFSQWIKHGTNRYEIDFKIIENDGTEKYIEIKSTDRLDKMDSKSRTKIKRLRKYYPEVSLIVVPIKNITSLGLGGLISNWDQ